MLPSLVSGGETTDERPQNHGIRRIPGTLLEHDVVITQSTRHGDCFLFCTYNAGTLSTDGDLHSFLEASNRIKFHVIVLQETKARKTDIRQLNNGTLAIRGEKVPSRNIGGVGFVVHCPLLISSSCTKTFPLA
ncbi:hypothetical protein KIN20_003077 [Parelaphostrongylus tenuis]|uniref:Endonuclease/exonuclease/phosphatase domain-containing protein n=1 Tax=Parelaphostrongylus tenuis TaxID=148309 RepID=A0AAD5MHS6_PARTN|nr:hypothetical protein KIN20_003077 [Parelaphostrongylus tenuis]